MQVFLETERLVLRRFTPEDVDLLVELDGDPEVMRYLTGGAPPPRAGCAAGRPVGRAFGAGAGARSRPGVAPALLDDGGWLSDPR
jgi:hypothetical protein